MIRFNIILIALLLFPIQSFAYLGPGMAGGVLATVVGIIAALFIAVFGLIYYPIKRALQKKNIESEAADE